MTMPEKINITVCFADGTGEWYHTNEVPEEGSDLIDGILIRTPYIRKDLADELAHIVEMAMRGKFLSEDGADALARYQAAMEGK